MLEDARAVVVLFVEHAVSLEREAHPVALSVVEVALVLVSVREVVRPAAGALIVHELSLCDAV